MLSFWLQLFPSELRKKSFRTSLKIDCTRINILDISCPMWLDSGVGNRNQMHYSFFLELVSPIRYFVLVLRTSESHSTYLTTFN